MDAKLQAIRQALADYMSSEGCDCCSDREAHAEHAAWLGKLLEVPMYSDGSGYDFSQFRSPRESAKYEPKYVDILKQMHSS